MRKAAGAGIAMLVMLAFAAGSTWSYMHDAETSDGNIVTAGTLDLVIEVAGTYSGTGAWYVTPGGNGINGRVGYDYIAADETGSITWVLSNTGNIDGTLSISSDFIFLDYSGVGQGSMGDNLMVNLQRGIGTNRSSAELNLVNILGTPASPSASSNLKALLELQEVFIEGAGGNDTLVYVLNWELESTPGDIYEDLLEIDLYFTLTQSW